ncbi:TIGR03016 family PEP-CTERM system-associated outer membrane protein [Geobacter sp. SVR]|uniref:TIGR03016 family PEP-CTERM system-associated outer membrane protein n=1 Tax=Geobacter sp. SVR TaxID=2495594 RepID=UPI00143EF895|nr:TIGR03016 family PEP-CTERM system-associated outer membrane protein [Geobacter sp. SVR]BCS54983.1 hypothetical protein GSVR_32910 [Geobacter sp. SVR]GCF85165.1 hypothetical protein GSbR_17650 [Geobacter sp. SVR]
MSSVSRISAILCALALAGAARAEDLTVHPSIAVGEEYTDNVFETRDNKIGDYITRIMPGLAIGAKGPVFSGDLNYQFDYHYYARNSRTNDYTHLLQAVGHLTAIDNFLFVDATSDYQRVPLDVTKDVRQESLFFDQTDRNVVTVSPFAVFHPTPRTTLKSGYSYINTHYFSSDGISKNDHSGFLSATYELTPKLSLTGDYIFIRELADVDNFNQHQVLGGFRYEYADKSFLFAQVGYSWIGYDSGQTFDNVNWKAGAIHVFDILTVEAATGVKYDEDPLRNITEETYVSGSVEKRFDRGALKLTLSFSKYVDVVTDTLDTRKYGLLIKGSRDLTSSLSATLAFTGERFEESAGNTRRLILETGLGYKLADELTATLTYIYVDYYSPNPDLDNKQINRVSLMLRKVF